MIAAAALGAKGDVKWDLCSHGIRTIGGSAIGSIQAGSEVDDVVVWALASRSLALSK